MTAPFWRPRTKKALIAHLESEHNRAVTVKLEPKSWTLQGLDDLHKIIHIGRGL
jgi:hypothetical protein